MKKKIIFGIYNFIIKKKIYLVWIILGKDYRLRDYFGGGFGEFYI